MGILSADFVGGYHARALQAQRDLSFLIGSKVGEVLAAGGAEKVTLRAIVAGVSEAVFEGGVKGDGVERHLDVDGGGELGTDAAHTLAGGAFALGGFAFNYQRAFASGFREVIGDAGADDASAYDGYFCGLHSFSSGVPPLSGASSAATRTST